MQPVGRQRRSVLLTHRELGVPMHILVELLKVIEYRPDAAEDRLAPSISHGSLLATLLRLAAGNRHEPRISTARPSQAGRIAWVSWQSPECIGRCGQRYYLGAMNSGGAADSDGASPRPQS